MLFNSYMFIFGFLPLTVGGYWLLREWHEHDGSQFWLMVASIGFYAYWDWRYAALLGGLATFNYWWGERLTESKSRLMLAGGVIANLGVLGYYKYANFFLDNLQLVTGLIPTHFSVVLPLGISFFTFQKIAYLVECQRGEARNRSYGRFLLFVFFFPQLIAGPIVHYRQINPQLIDLSSGRKIGIESVARGLFLFAVGLFKKVVIADSLSKLVDPAYAAAATQSLLEAWTACLAYAFQLYYDFSGYSDMAIGLALLFGVRLPRNFNQPYRATNIADFWRRWHITLGAFLREYVYIPLGGNRKGFGPMLLASFLVMVIGGFWHGAGWTFILWGAMHGSYLLIYRIWARFGFRLPAGVGAIITFLGVLMAWVPFRAASMSDAVHMWKALVGLQGVYWPSWVQGFGIAVQGPTLVFPAIKGFEIIFLILLLGAIWWERNLQQFKDGFTRSGAYLAAFWAMSMSAIVMLAQPSTFMYFQF